MQDQVIKEIKVIEYGAMTELYTPYNPDFVLKVKSINGKKWNSQKKCWSIPTENLNEAREYMTDIYGYDDISQPVTYEYSVFTPIGPKGDPDIPWKDQIFGRHGKACKCTSVKYNDDLHETYVHYTDITDTDDGKAFIENQHIEQVKKMTLKELRHAKKFLKAEEHSSYDCPKDIKFSDEDILWKEVTAMGNDTYTIFANSEIAGVLHVYGYDTTIYNYSYKPRQEAEEFVETIKHLVKDLSELTEEKRKIKENLLWKG